MGKIWRCFYTVKTPYQPPTAQSSDTESEVSATTTLKCRRQQPWSVDLTISIWFSHILFKCRLLLFFSNSGVFLLVFTLYLSNIYIYIYIYIYIICNLGICILAPICLFLKFYCLETWKLNIIYWLNVTAYLDIWLSDTCYCNLVKCYCANLLIS